MKHAMSDRSIVESSSATSPVELGVTKILNGLLAILLGIAIFGAVTSGNLQRSGHWGLLWLTVTLVCACCWLLRRRLYALYGMVCDSRLCIIVLFGVLTLIQVVVFTSISGVMAYDAGEVFNGVFATDKSDTNFYLSVWQNNVPLYVFEHAVSAVFGLDGGIWSVRFFAVLCCLSYDLGFLLLALGMNKLYGRRVAVATGLLSFAVLGLTNQMYQFYTTALSWPFTCLGIYLYIMFRSVRTLKGQMGICLAFGVTVACGYIVRPSSIIYCIALALIEIVKACGGFTAVRDNWRRILAGLLAVICGAGLVAGSYTLARDANTRDLHMDENKNATMAQYLAYGITGDGAGTEEVREQVADAPNVAERKQVALSIWKARLQELGPVGYVDFLVKKHVSETRDGSYSLLMPHTEERYSANPVKHLLQDMWYSNGRYVRVTMFCMQVIYLLFLTGAWFGVFVNRERFGTFLVLSLIGWHAFLLLFEGARTGYTVQAFPVMIPLAVLGLRHMVHMAQAVSATNQIRSSMI